jgi:hypothetical protein
MISGKLVVAIVAFALVVVMLLAVSVSGDVVELKDPTLIKGTYAGGTPDQIRLETADGVREIARAEALSLTFTAPTPPPAGATAQPAAATAGMSRATLPVAVKRTHAAHMSNTKVLVQTLTFEEV